MTGKPKAKAKIFKIMPLAGLYLAVAVTVSGCGLKNTLGRIDAALGRGFDYLERVRLVEIFGGGRMEALPPAGLPLLSTSTIAAIAQNLTAGEKAGIDAWLEAKGYNRFGDPLETDYAGGTPLINETTGEAIERFEYILNHHPEIVAEAGLDYILGGE